MQYLPLMHELAVHSGFVCSQFIDKLVLALQQVMSTLVQVLSHPQHQFIQLNKLEHNA